MTAADLPLLQPDVFASCQGVRAAFSTRHGGVSTGPYASLNLGDHVGDSAERVQENRRRMLQALGFKSHQLAVGVQVHGRRVQVVESPGVYQETDGLVTATAGIALAIMVADCAAVLLADPEARVAGACHAGWRGAVAGILPETMGRMEELGAQADRVRAYVSPCISAAHFEVGTEVAEQFDDTFVRHPDGAPRPFVDLKAVVADALRYAGVKDRHVETSPQCTVEETATFFSYRAENGRTGRMMGIIGLH